MIMQIVMTQSSNAVMTKYEFCKKALIETKDLPNFSRNNSIPIHVNEFRFLVTLKQLSLKRAREGMFTNFSTTNCTSFFHQSVFRFIIIGLISDYKLL